MLILKKRELVIKEIQTHINTLFIILYSDRFHQTYGYNKYGTTHGVL